MAAGEGHRRTLGDYFTLQRGTTYKSRLLGQPGPVLLGLATIERNGGFRTDSLQTYGGESPAKLLVQPGDLYLSLKDVTQSADLLGAVARLPIDHSPGRLTQDTVKLEPKGTDVPLDYLYWLRRTPQYRSYCRAHATGTTNLGLSREDFLTFPAPEPTPFQRKIVETLGTLDHKIELNRRMNETLEAMARAIFKSWFVDFDPVRAKAEGRDPGLPKHIADLFPDRFEDSELGGIPAGWSIDTLGNLIGLAYGKALKEEDRESGEIAVFGSNGQVGWHDEKLVAGPGIVVGRKGNPGVVTWAPTDFFPIDTTFYVVPNVEICSLHFLFYALKMHDLASLGADSAVPGLNRNLAYMSRQIVPRGTVLEVFDSVVQSFFQRMHQAEKESSTLSGLRDTLLPKLMSGELQVKDGESVMGAVV
jgi:type I restriction enzyme, S subunit